MWHPRISVGRGGRAFLFIYLFNSVSASCVFLFLLGIATDTAQKAQLLLLVVSIASPGADRYGRQVGKRYRR